MNNGSANIGNSDSKDTFSFGVFLYELFSEQEPWKGLSGRDAAIRVLEGARIKPPSDNLPDGVAELMSSCFQDLNERPKMVDIYKRLSSLRT